MHGKRIKVVSSLKLKRWISSRTPNFGSSELKMCSELRRQSYEQFKMSFLI